MYAHVCAVQSHFCHFLPSWTLLYSVDAPVLARSNIYAHKQCSKDNRLKYVYEACIYINTLRQQSYEFECRWVAAAGHPFRTVITPVSIYDTWRNNSQFHLAQTPEDRKRDGGDIQQKWGKHKGETNEQLELWRYYNIYMFACELISFFVSLQHHNVSFILHFVNAQRVKVHFIIILKDQCFLWFRSLVCSTLF